MCNDPRTNKFHTQEDVIFETVTIVEDEKGEQSFADAEEIGKIVNVRPYGLTDDGEVNYVYNIVANGDELLVNESDVKRVDYAE